MTPDQTVTLQITPTDSVHSWLDEPTASLRWKGGVLEQMHRRRGYNAYGQEIRHYEEWVAVPNAD